MTLSDKLLAQCHIIFDNAVMRNRDIACAITMWMSVALTGRSVRCPTSMPNARRTRHRLCSNAINQVLEFAFTTAHFKFIFSRNSNTSRIISAVLKASKSLKQYLVCLAMANVPNNSAHSISSTPTR